MMRKLSVIVALVALCGCAGTAALPPQAAVLNEAGVEAMRHGDLETARARLALALEYHPKFVDALVNLALVEMQRGNFKLARRKLDEATSINRHLAQPHHGLGVLAEREAKFDKAAEHYEEALEVDPGFVASRINLARLYFEAGRLDHAREQLLRLVQLAPHLPEAHAGLAEALYRLGRNEDAERVVEGAVQLIGEHPELRLLQARGAVARQQLERAESLLQPLLSLEGPVARDAWAWRGVIELARNDIDGAIRCSEHALSFDRNHALGTFVLAMTLARRGDRDAAAWLERARALSPGNSVIAAEIERIGQLTPPQR